MLLILSYISGLTIFTCLWFTVKRLIKTNVALLKNPLLLTFSAMLITLIVTGLLQDKLISNLGLNIYNSLTKIMGGIALVALYTFLGRLSKNLYAARLVLVVGIMLNFTVVAFNDGRMPCDRTVMQKAGIVGIASDDTRHVIADKNTKLAFLGDTIYHPVFTGPYTVESMGDILIGIALILAAVQLARRRFLAQCEWERSN